MDPLDSRTATGLRIRDAAAVELDEVGALPGAVNAAFREHFPSDAWELNVGEIVDVRTRFGESEAIVAECGVRVVGTIGFYPEAPRSALERWPAGWGSIRTLGVCVEARRRRAGDTPAQDCVRRARTRELRAVGLHTASYLSAATRLYPRVGFCRAAEFDIEIGEIFTGRPLASAHSWMAQACRLDLEEAWDA